MNFKSSALVKKIGKPKTPISPANAQYKKNMEGAYKSKYGSFK